MRAISAVLALFAVGLFGNPLAAQETVIARPYVAGGVHSPDAAEFFIVVICAGQRVAGVRPAVDVGGACLSNEFSAHPTPATSVDITVDDATGHPVLGRYEIAAGGGDVIDGVFCSSVSGIPVPGEIWSFMVSLYIDASNDPVCHGSRVPSAGTVTAVIQ